MIIAGLDDAVADHAEVLLERLEQTPPQYPGQIERDARRALIRLEKERFDYLMRQLQSSIAAAERAGRSGGAERSPIHNSSRSTSATGSSIRRQAPTFAIPGTLTGRKRSSGR